MINALFQNTTYKNDLSAFNGFLLDDRFLSQQRLDYTTGTFRDPRGTIMT
jgi:hypothetical protein